MTNQTRTTRPTRLWIVAALSACLLLIGAASAFAANPYERGPDPTLASVEATSGTFAYASLSVSSGNGFGGGTIYYPTSTTDGTFAGIVTCPGFTNSGSSMAWFGKVLASQGFVTLVMNPKSNLDFPDARATQMLAALDWLTNSSSVKTRIDATRLGVLGQSMGGGATLKASKTRPSLKASFATAPYNSDKDWSTNTVPQFLFGMQNDTTAAVTNHALKFYNSLPATTPKIYAELRGAGHSTATSPNTSIRRYAVSFMKRNLDNDTRYSQFLCPGPTITSSSPLSAFMSNCLF
ncbi:MAG: hypothetical protein JHC87_03920 [Thermoleophilaceae bacterium]|nr:hypothetical protein [Thermoleophilaceae bacterium]